MAGDRGHVWLGCVCGREVCMTGGAYMAGSVHSRRDGHCSGWYTSYWNAFSFDLVLVLVSMRKFIFVINFLVHNRN